MSKPAFEVIDIKGEMPPKRKPAARPVQPDAKPARIGHGLNGPGDEQAMAEYHAQVRTELDAYDAECARVAKQAIGVNAYARPTPGVLQDKPLSNDGFVRNSVPEFICSYSDGGVLLHQIRNPAYIRPRSRLEYLADESRKLRDQLVLANDRKPRPRDQLSVAQQHAELAYLDAQPVNSPQRDNNRRRVLQALFDQDERDQAALAEWEAKWDPVRARLDAVNAEIAALDAVDPDRIEARRLQAEAEARDAENRRRENLEAARAKAERAKAEYERATAEMAEYERAIADRIAYCTQNNQVK